MSKSRDEPTSESWRRQRLAELSLPLADLLTEGCRALFLCLAQLEGVQREGLEAFWQEVLATVAKKGPKGEEKHLIGDVTAALSERLNAASDERRLPDATDGQETQ